MAGPNCPRRSPAYLHLWVRLSKASDPLVRLVDVGTAQQAAAPDLLNEVPLLSGQDGSERVRTTAEQGPRDFSVGCHDVHHPLIALGPGDEAIAAVSSVSQVSTGTSSLAPCARYRHF